MWKIIEQLCHQAGIHNEEEMRYYLINFQAGFTMTLKHWVDTDCKISETEIAAIIKNCVPHILMQNNQ